MYKRILTLLILVMALTGCPSPTVIKMPSQVPSQSPVSDPVSPLSPGTKAPVDAMLTAEAWRQELSLFPYDKQNADALGAWKSSSIPAIKDRAMYVVACSNLSESLAAQQALNRLYHADNSQKALMESTMQEEVAMMGAKQLLAIVNSIPGTQRTAFPWTIFLLEAAKRNIISDSTTVIAEISPFLFNNALVYSTPTQSASLASTNLALAVPLSGPLSSMGQKIVNGANVAVQDLAENGVNIGLSVINTEDPNWTSVIASLPANCALIGGPIGTAKLTEAKNSGLTTSKAFFSFSSQLDLKDEGTVAWRFFSSPEDQVTALLNFVISDLGIKNIGIIYPEDSYGQKMADLFMQNANLRGANITPASYPVGASVELTAITKSLLNPYNVGKGVFARTDFQAVFLPEAYAQSELIVSNLNFNGEDRLVLLGTSLWEQGGALNPLNMDLAVYPGTYNQNFPNAAGTILSDSLAIKELPAADSWSSLGYDFVQFAAALNLDSTWSPYSLNSKLSSLGNVFYSGAPISYNANGMAKQNMTLFRPSKEGIKALDVPSFIQDRERINARYERRLNNARTNK